MSVRVRRLFLYYPGPNTNMPQRTNRLHLYLLILGLLAVCLPCTIWHINRFSQYNPLTHSMLHAPSRSISFVLATHARTK